MSGARYRIVFFGTPEFAVPSLQALYDGPDEVLAVVCQPDRPAGRGQRLQKPPVKELAERLGIPVFQPPTLRGCAPGGELFEALRALEADLFVVAAYGRILPRALLQLPRLGCVNVHASLLPRYRGAAPIQWAILRGERTTGITIMQMNERMDEGDILLQRELEIGSDETCGELQTRLAELGAQAVREALAERQAGRLSPRPQDDAAATLAPMIRKEDGEIDWSAPAALVARQVRAFHPWPSAYTFLAGKRVKIHRARGAAEAVSAIPGTVIEVGPCVRVATGDGVLAIESLQLEGRPVRSAADLCRGGVIKVGDRFGDDRHR
jgi:methionyl-tRNA formyltransferase